jgi:hypothetical protein
MWKQTVCAGEERVGLCNPDTVDQAWSSSRFPWSHYLIWSWMWHVWHLIAKTFFVLETFCDISHRQVEKLLLHGMVSSLTRFPGRNMRVHLFLQHPVYLFFKWSSIQVLFGPNVTWLCWSYGYRYVQRGKSFFLVVTFSLVAISAR